MGRSAATIREITEHLDTLRLDRPTTIDEVLPAIQESLEAESILIYNVVERPHRWELERIHSHGFRVDSAFWERLAGFFATAPRRYAWFDPSRPEPDQRDRVIDALDIIPEREYEESRIYAEVMRPSGVHQHRQPRVLVCDGPSLLAWFGALHPERFDAEQNRRLDAMVPAMRRRLRIERQLKISARAQVILDCVLEELGAPAFVIGAGGLIHEVNRSGRALLDMRRAEVMSSLRDAVLKRAAPVIPFELTRVEESGTSACWLAIARAGSGDDRVQLAVATATARWALTPRQRAVLEMVVRGIATATIAAQMRVTERAVELHLTAMFDRVGVESRTALVAAVLAAV